MVVAVGGVDGAQRFLAEQVPPLLAATGILGRLTEFALDAIERFNYVGIGFLVALENIFPPVPSEVILPLVGFLCGQGRLVLPLAIIVATLGSVVGSLVLYALGAWYGEVRLRRFLARYGKWVGMGEDDVTKANRFFNAHGNKAVFLFRLIPLGRSLISIPAGFTRMSLVPFILYSAAGSGLWNAFLIGLGWFAGDNWAQVEGYVKPFEYLGIAAVVIAVVAFVVRRRMQASRETRQEVGTVGKQ